MVQWDVRRHGRNWDVQSTSGFSNVGRRERANGTFENLDMTHHQPLVLIHEPSGILVHVIGKSDKIRTIHFQRPHILRE
jgi:hypothetical protein